MRVCAGVSLYTAPYASPPPPLTRERPCRPNTDAAVPRGVSLAICAEEEPHRPATHCTSSTRQRLAAYKGPDTNIVLAPPRRPIELISHQERVPLLNPPSRRHLHTSRTHHLIRGSGVHPCSCTSRENGHDADTGAAWCAGGGQPVPPSRRLLCLAAAARRRPQPREPAAATPPSVGAVPGPPARPPGAEARGTGASGRRGQTVRCAQRRQMPQWRTTCAGQG